MKDKPVASLSAEQIQKIHDSAVAAFVKITKQEAAKTVSGRAGDLAEDARFTVGWDQVDTLKVLCVYAAIKSS